MKRRITALLMTAAIIFASFTTTVEANTDTKLSARQALDVVTEFMPYGHVESFQNGGNTYHYIVVEGGERFAVVLNAYSGEIESFTRQTAAIVQQTVTPQVVVPQTVAPQAVTPVNQQSSISADYAGTIALERAGGGVIARVETKYPKHGTEYKAIVVNGDWKYDVTVNASTGAITKMKTKQITTVSGSANNYYAVFSADSAKTTAIQYAGGGVITECKLEYKSKEGVLRYHMHVAAGQYEHCIHLCATTGNVLKYELRHKG